MESLSSNQQNENRETERDVAPTNRKQNIKCDTCKENFATHKQVINHMQNVHGKKIDPVKIIFFSSESKFHEWKDHEELRTFSYYSQQTGQKKGIRYFKCQFDGQSKAHRAAHEPDRLSSVKKRIGQVKKDFTCISQIIVRNEAKGGLKVEYYSTHSHELKESNVKYQPPTNQARSYIKQQVSLNVPAAEIHAGLQDMEFSRENREKVGSSNCSRNLVTSERSIREQKAKVRKSQQLHKDDATAVFLLVEQLKQESYNSVCLYKPLGKDIVVGPENMHCIPSEIDSLFMIGIQTKAQRDLLVLGANKIVVADDTHNVTGYENTRMLNILVVDENNCGWVVGHLISNFMTSHTISYFIEAINDRVTKSGQVLNINVLITDDDPAIINGFKKGLKTTIRHILCQWHLKKAIQKKIAEKARENFQEIFDQICLIINTTNSEEFAVLYKSFLKTHEKNEALVQYFESTYSNRVEKWAMHCRMNIGHGNVNTTANAESFHNKLKTKYMERIPNKRMEDLIRLLLTIEKDEYVARKRNSIIHPILSPNYHVKRHTQGLQMSDDCLVAVSDQVWQIQSSSSSEEEECLYVIKQIYNSCPSDHCYTKCSEISCFDLCMHLYKCSCPDIDPLCKHVHKLHSYRKRGIVVGAPEDDVTHVAMTVGENVPSSSIDSPTSYEHQQHGSGSSVVRAYSRIDENMKKLQMLISSKDLPPHLLFSADSFIEQLLHRVEAEKKIPAANVASFPECRVINPKEKLATQESQLLPFKRKNKRVDRQNLALKKKRLEDARESLLLSQLNEEHSLE